MPKDNEATDLVKTKLELFEAVDKRVSEQFDRASDFLKLTIGAAMKVLGGALVLLLIVLTLFGIKTARDLSQAIEQITRSEISRRLEEQDPVAAYLKEAESLFNRALVDSVQIAIARGAETDDPFDDPELSAVQQQRLLRILSTPETNVDLFQQAAVSLEKASPRELWQTAAEEIFALISAADDYAWMEREPRKRKVLIEVLADRRYPAASDAIRTLIRKAPADESLQIAAVQYAAASGDFAAINDIEALAISNSPDLREATILALARLKPLSQSVADWISDYDQAQDSSLLRHGDALRLFAALLEGNPKYRRVFFEEDPDDADRKRTAKALLVAALRAGIRFYSFESHRKQRERGLSITLGADPSNFHGVPNSILFGRGVGVAFDLLREQAGDATKFAALIDAFSVQSSGGGARLVILRVDLRGAAKLVLGSGQEVGIAEAARGASLVPNRGGEDLAVLVNWRDQAGLLKSGTFARAHGGDSLSFSLETDVRFGRE